MPGMVSPVWTAQVRAWAMMPGMRGVLPCEGMLRSIHSPPKSCLSFWSCDIPHESFCMLFVAGLAAVPHLCTCKLCLIIHHFQVILLCIRLSFIFMTSRAARGCLCSCLGL